jgi:predicted methyltransferase
MIGAGLAAALVGCSRDEKKTPAAASTPAKPPAPEGSLEWAVAGPWRIDPARDAWRRPIETLRFFGVSGGMNVIEIMPGRGWYTAILAPYLARGGGALTVATFDPMTATPDQQATLEAFDARFADQDTFGVIRETPFSAASGPLGPLGSADMVLVFRNIHTLMAGGFAEKAFRDFHDVLKPGGVLGIEQHRAKSTAFQDPQARTGYVQEAFVKALAQEAGFEFVGSSEVNANPKDTKDHPFGVWTLPPTLRGSPLGMPDAPSPDAAKYRAIGESDRMTLKFRKPSSVVAPARTGKKS